MLLWLLAKNTASVPFYTQPFVIFYSLSIASVLPDHSGGDVCYFSTLLVDKTIALRLDKLSLPVTQGQCDMACKIAHHVVAARRIMGVTTVIANKNLVFDA